MGVEPGRGRAGIRVVGFDPGLADTGYAALESGRGAPSVLGSGVIRTHRAERLEVRLEQLFEETQEVLDRFAPDLLVVEDVFSLPAVPRTAILMGHARGVICLAAAEAGIEMTSYSATQVKKILTGNGRAPKSQVQQAIRRELGLAKIPEPADVADALALAYTGLSRARGLGRLGPR